MRNILRLKEDMAPGDVADFFMFNFKTRECTARQPHEWKNCCCFHPREKARRRDPRQHEYVADACTDFMRTGRCSRGDDCFYAHGVFETWLHPTKFRTVMCSEGSTCRRKVCWFAHSQEELRKLQPPPATAAGVGPAPGATPLAAASAAGAGRGDVAGSPPANRHPSPLHKYAGGGDTSSSNVTVCMPTAAGGRSLLRRPITPPGAAATAAAQRAVAAVPLSQGMPAAAAAATAGLLPGSFNSPSSSSISHMMVTGSCAGSSSSSSSSASSTSYGGVSCSVDPSAEGWRLQQLSLSSSNSTSSSPLPAGLGSATGAGSACGAYGGGLATAAPQLSPPGGIMAVGHGGMTPSEQLLHLLLPHQQQQQQQQAGVWVQSQAMPSACLPPPAPLLLPGGISSSMTCGGVVGAVVPPLHVTIGALPVCTPPVTPCLLPEFLALDGGGLPCSAGGVSGTGVAASGHCGGNNNPDLQALLSQCQAQALQAQLEAASAQAAAVTASNKLQMALTAIDTLAQAGGAAYAALAAVNGGSSGGGGGVVSAGLAHVLPPGSRAVDWL